MTTLVLWHEIVDTRDASALDGLLDEHVVFESPVVHTPQRGRTITKKYLDAALLVLNNGHFRYIEEWSSASSAVLEFTTEIDGIVINGVDIIRWNDAGKIVHFKVMVRPLKAIDALHRKMGDLLSRSA